MTPIMNKTPAKGKNSKKGPKKVIAKKEPGTQDEKECIPKSTMHNLFKDRWSNQVSAANDMVMRELIMKFTKNLVSVACIEMQTEGKRTMTEQHIKRAVEKIGLAHLI